jgi:hypothetical protein
MMMPPQPRRNNTSPQMGGGGAAARPTYVADDTFASEPQGTMNGRAGGQPPPGMTKRKVG